MAVGSLITKCERQKSASSLIGISECYETNIIIKILRLHVHDSPTVPKDYDF